MASHSIDLERVRDFYDRTQGSLVATVYGPLSHEDQVYVRSVPSDLAAGAAVDEALQRLGYTVARLDPNADGLLDVVKSADYVFINAHGEFAEDGRLQGLLDYLAIPYTGSGAMGHCLSIDKITSKRIAMSDGILTPRCVAWQRVPTSEEIGDACSTLGTPVIIKPVAGGSSIGTRVAANSNEAVAAVRQLAFISSGVMIEEHISGRDVTLGLLDCGYGLHSLPPLEIRAHRSHYDERAKMLDHFEGGVDYTVYEGDESAKLAQHSQRLASVLHLRGFSRMDWIVDWHNRLWFLENNTNPGLSQRGNLALAAQYAGLSFDELVLTMLSTATFTSVRQSLSAADENNSGGAFLIAAN